MQKFSLKMPIRWMDMDAYGHVNNGRYCDFMVETRFHWFNQINVLKSWVETNRIQFVMVKQTIEYLKPFTFPGEIEVVQWVKTIGRSSVELTYELYLVGEPLAPYATAYAKLVAFSSINNASIMIPEIVESKLLSL